MARPKTADDILDLIRNNKKKPLTEEQIQAKKEKAKREHPYHQLDPLDQAVERLKDSELWQDYNSIGKPLTMQEFLEKNKDF